MLPPDARTILTDALKPPAGWMLDRAVALTFTVDLPSALVVPLVFAPHGVRETTDPLHVMEAIRSCTDRVDIFCQAGHIVVPKSASELLAFLEPMIHPVRPPRPGFLFHPKLWLVRYREPDAGEVAIRLLVLSRNITGDRSWDVCLRLDGTIDKPEPNNKPLRDIIRGVTALAVGGLQPNRRDAVYALADDVHRARWELPSDVDGINFYTLGIPGASEKPSFAGTRGLVISPFVNEIGLKQTLCARERTLVARQEELDRLPEDVLAGVTAYVVDEFAELADEERESQTELLSGLHAKLYISESGQRARVLLGSVNATGAALEGNVELLAELHGSRKTLGVQRMLDEAEGIGPILIEYQRQDPEPEDSDQRKLEELLRTISIVPLTATVTGEGERRGVELTSDRPMPDMAGAGVTVELLTRQGEANELYSRTVVNERFADIEITEITPFIVVTAEASADLKASTVVRAQLFNDPVDRLDRVLAGQINTPEKFKQFLALLLGLSGDASAFAARGSGSGSGWITQDGRGILELLLGALADNSTQLADLGRLIARLSQTEQGRSVLPPGFVHLWAIVDEARAALEEAR